MTDALAFPVWLQGLTVTSVLAVYAAILSTLTFVRLLLTDRKGSARLRVTVYLGREVGRYLLPYGANLTPEGQVAAPPKPESAVLVFSIANTGGQPIVVNFVGGTYAKSWRDLLFFRSGRDFYLDRPPIAGQPAGTALAAGGELPQQLAPLAGTLLVKSRDRLTREWMRGIASAQAIDSHGRKWRASRRNMRQLRAQARCYLPA